MRTHTYKGKTLRAPATQVTIPAAIRADVSTVSGPLACPLIAGIQAVAEQNRSFAIGFANPLLHSMRKSAFKDVITGRGTPKGTTFLKAERH